MKSLKILGFAFLVVLCSAAANAGGLNEKDYADMYALRDMKSHFGPSIAACLNAWGNQHPFKDKKKIKFRVIEGNVKVFGVGGNIYDDSPTNYPQLILVKPGVNVMGKMAYDLLNPNGWYCLKAKVNVMGKSVINLACKAHLASTSGTTTVLGASQGQSGTTVLGKTVVNRECGEEL